MLKLYTTLILLFCFVVSVKSQVKNFTVDGKQVTRFDNLGDAVDAHDGEIAFFNGTYYLYGTSYDCGFEWNNKTAPFCGFKSYSSKDLVNWKDEGYLFDAKNPLWQSRCDGKTYGCFRPHVIYNSKSKRYVLWINVYDNVSGYRVFTSKHATGPFVEENEPKISVNSDKPAAGLNNGDHDLFIDDDGKGYLIFTDWRAKGSIVIEQLTDDYLSGNGTVEREITTERTEAPALFKRNGIYYVTYSDPNCGYCSGTGTSYKTAKSPLGPWSEGQKISDNSCGGQPSFVSTMKVNSQTIYLYGSDLWNNAAKNEALANFFWAPLTFAADGSIEPIDCSKSFAVGTNTKSINDVYTDQCAVDSHAVVNQAFVSKKNGRLTSFSFTTAKSGYPNKDLEVSFYESSPTGKTGRLLKSYSIYKETIGWSINKMSIKTRLSLKRGKKYLVRISSETSKGCYALSFDGTTGKGSKLSSASGNRKLRYSYLIE